ncbi:MAG TPA: flippase [Thermoplasmata archaeon]|nr:flippase [Thermoplasmata archaeon]
MGAVTFGTLLMLLGTLGFVGQGFVSRVILARALSPVQWGEYSLGLALAGLLSSIGTLGLTSAIARSLAFAQNDAERRSMVRSSFLVTLAAAVVLSAALYVFGVYVGATYPAEALSLTIEFFAVSVAFSIVSSLIASIFQGYEDVVPNAVFVNILNPALFIVFLVAAIRTAAPGQVFPSALAAYLAASVITFASLATYARWRLRRRLPSGPRAAGAARRLFLFAAPLFLVSVLGYLTGNTDTLILGVYHQADVGYYTAGLSLARLVLVGVGALSYIYLPVAARFLRQGDHEAITLTYVTATKWMVLVSLPLFIVFVFLPGPSLGLVYGTAYQSHVLPLEVLATGAFVSTLAGPAAATQISLGQTRLLVYNNAATGAIDILLSVTLIPSMGIVGAAIAWAVSNAVNPVLSMVELAVLSDVHPMRAHYVVPVVGTTVPLVLIFRLVPVPSPFWFLPVLVLLIAAVFILVVFLTASVDRGDRLVLEVLEGMIGRPLGIVRRVARWRLALGRTAPRDPALVR